VTKTDATSHATPGAPSTRPDSAPITRPDGALSTRLDGAPIAPAGCAPITRPDGAPIARADGAPIARADSAPIARSGGALSTRVDGAPIARADSAPNARPAGAPNVRSDGAPVSRLGGAPSARAAGVPSAGRHGAIGARHDATPGVLSVRADAAAGAKARWPWIVAGVVGVVVLGSVVVAATRDDEKRAAGAPVVAASSAGPPRTEEAAQLGRMGADGAFIVTVTRLRCGVPAVGPADLQQAAKGSFCLVSVAVENAGQEPRLLDGSAQHAVDGHGRAYAVDDRAAAFLNEQLPSLLDQIPANTTVRGVLPFDVPPGTRLSALLIHGSEQGRGGRIPLS
jgi:hypothetical protein